MAVVTEDEFVAKTAKHHRKSPAGYVLWRSVSCYPLSRPNYVNLTEGSNEMKENGFGRFLPRGLTTVGKGQVEIRFTESPNGRVVGRLEDPDKVIKRSIKRAYANMETQLLRTPKEREAVVQMAPRVMRTLAARGK